MQIPSRSRRTHLVRLAVAMGLALGLAACGGGTGSGDVGSGGDDAVSSPTDGDASGDTSMPADDASPHDGSVSEGEAEAVGTAYLGLTVEEAEAQAEVDDRAFRIGEEDGEAYMLTEDYVIGRVTATVTDGVITEVVVEATDGPVTVSS